MILLSWEIGNLILQRQKEFGWSAKIIDRMAYDLKMSFMIHMVFLHAILSI